MDMFSLTGMARGLPRPQPIEPGRMTSRPTIAPAPQPTPPPVPHRLRGATVAPTPRRGGLGLRRDARRLPPSAYLRPARRTPRRPQPLDTLPPPMPAEVQELDDSWFLDSDGLDEISLDRMRPSALSIPIAEADAGDELDDDVEITWRRGVSPWAVAICLAPPMLAAGAGLAWVASLFL